MKKKESSEVNSFEKKGLYVKELDRLEKDYLEKEQSRFQSNLKIKCLCCGKESLSCIDYNYCLEMAFYQCSNCGYSGEDYDVCDPLSRPLEEVLKEHKSSLEKDLKRVVKQKEEIEERERVIKEWLKRTSKMLLKSLKSASKNSDAMIQFFLKERQD